MMRGKMRVLALWLCFMLLLGAPLACAQGEIIYHGAGGSGSEQLRAMAHWAGATYLIAGDGALYAYEGGALSPLTDNHADHAPAGGYSEIAGALAGADGLYAIVFDYMPDEFAPHGMRLCGMAIDGDRAVLDAGLELDVREIAREYLMQDDLRYPVIAGGRLLFSTAGDFYNDGAVYAFDLQTGDCETHQLGGAFAGVSGICAYGAQAILSMYDYAAGEHALLTLDLETGEAREFYALPGEEMSEDVISNLAYDAAADMLYYTFGGRLLRMQGLDPETAEEVATAPLGGRTVFAAQLTGEGAILIGDIANVLLRATEPAPAQEVRLRIHTGGMQPMMDAQAAFAARHPEVETVLTGSSGNVTEAMLSRSGDVDIYVLPVEQREYGSLYERGYLADLSESAAIRAFVEEMYPGIQSAVTKDGAPVAIPLDIYTMTMGYNPYALEMMGLSADDLPTTWAEFFQYLNEIAPLAEEAGVYPVSPGDFVSMYRIQRIVMIFDQYMCHLKQAEDAQMAFDTPVLHEVLHALDDLDYEALGIEAEPFEGSRTFEGEKLFDQDVLYIEGISRYLQYAAPLPLALAEGMEPILATRMQVAFVNPYSAHPDLAVEYLECVLDALPATLRAQASPAANEPLREPEYEKAIAAIDKNIEDAQAELARADEDDIKTWKARIAELEEAREKYDTDRSWIMSPADIEQYRAYAKYIHVSEYFGLGEDNQQEFYELLYQYRDGALTPEELLAAIDKKIMLMILEGQ